MAAYYNEFDSFAAAWLRELIKAGLIADGEVDERSIESVRPDDLRGFVQCHFFAGIGGWSAALRLAGWPDDRPVWTGSCPCQPFSAAGKGGGKDDARHLWPQFRRLIRQCRPAVVFGEQVASKAGRVWLSAVFADLEALAYRTAGADLCGPSVGAYDIRQRLWFVADDYRERFEGQRLRVQPGRSLPAGLEIGRCGEAGELADTEHAIGRALDGRDGRDRTNSGRQEAHGEPGARGQVRELADADGWDAEHGGVQRGREHGLRAEGRRAAGCQGDAERAEAISLGDTGGEGLEKRDGIGRVQRAAVRASEGEAAERGGDADWLGDTDDRGEVQIDGISRRPDIERARGFWADVEWLPCRDGKYRPVESGTFPLATGVPARVGRLRGYGNAIKPQVAAAFIEAYREAR